MRDHQAVVATLGLRVIYLKLITFSLGAMVIGAVGRSPGHLFGSASVDNFTIALSIKYIAIIMVLRLDSLAGAVVGAELISALPIWRDRWLSVSESA